MCVGHGVGNRFCASIIFKNRFSTRDTLLAFVSIVFKLKQCISYQKIRLNRIIKGYKYKKIMTIPY